MKCHVEFSLREPFRLACIIVQDQPLKLFWVVSLGQAVYWVCMHSKATACVLPVLSLLLFATFDEACFSVQSIQVLGVCLF